MLPDSVTPSFIEDVEEAPYRIDRMLTQLALAGILKEVRAVIWGVARAARPAQASAR